MSTNANNKNVNQAAIFVGMLMWAFFSSVHMNIASPAISDMVSDLAITNSTVAGMLTTLPSLTCIPTVLLCGKLCESVNKKYVWAIGVIIWILGGFGATWFHTAGMVLVFRGILGLGVGLVVPLLSAIPLDFYEGKRAATQVGIQLGVSGIWAGIAAAVAGMLMSHGWRAAFSLHLVAIPVLILGFLLIPKKPTVTDSSTAEVPEGEVVDKGKLGGVVLLFALMLLLFMLPYYTGYGYVALLAEAEQTATAAQIGAGFSAASICAAIVAICFGFIQRIFKFATASVGCLVLLIGYVLILAGQPGTIIVGLAFLGMSAPLLIPNCLSRAAQSTSLAKQTMAQSIVLIGMYLGMFLAAPWYTLCEKISGGTIKDVFKVNIGACVVLMVIFFILMLTYEKRSKKKAEAEAQAEA